MRNQFFYTRTVQSQAEEVEGAENIVTSFYRDSFSLDFVIRSVSLPSGEVIVLLNDLHEQIQQVPVVNPKTNKVTYKEVKIPVQSEITLSPSDGKRFFNLTNVEDCQTSYAEERAEILEKANMSITE